MTVAAIFKLNANDDPVPANWDLLSTILANPDISYAPEWTFAPQSTFSDKGDGGRHGQGFPIITWRWKGLRFTQREALRAYCPNLSADVYLASPTNETSSGVRIWKQWRAQMLWMPADEDVDLNAVRQVDIEFRMCVEIP